MPDVNAINAHQWRQGSIFKEDDRNQLAEILQVDIPEDTRLIVVSQDCDIVHPSIEGEPFVEVLFAKLLIDGAIGPFTYGKNPRRLHIPISINGEDQYFECTSRRYLLDRQLLENLSSDLNSLIDAGAIAIIRSWLAARYTRTAFPDAFNTRVAKGVKDQEKKLKARGADLSGIYIALHRWGELDNEEPYHVMLVATMESEAWSSRKKRHEMSVLLSDIAGILNGSVGIEVDDFELRSEANLSIEDLRSLRRWDYDYLSYREAPGGPLPPQ